MHLRGITVRSLRTQLLVSHLVLVALMVLVMAGAVVNFFRLGLSIDKILKNNYASVVAAQNMKETLERQDSAATFYLAGQVAKARTQFTQNRPRFEEAYRVEANNITEPGEQQMADDIRLEYDQYRLQLERLLAGTPPFSPQAARAFYFTELEPAFLHLKQRAQDVLDINQAAIVHADARARDEARRATINGIAITACAFLVALALVRWTVRAALLPLRSLAVQAEQIGIGHLNQRIELQRTDEIGVLAGSFNQMATRLRAARALEEARLHRAESMSDAALNSLYDPVLVTDAAGRMVHLNRAAEGLFGQERRLIGVPIDRAVPDVRIVEAVMHAIHQQGVSAAEGAAGFVGLEVDEAQRTYRLRATPMHDEAGVLLGAAAVLEDVTHLMELDRLKTEFIGVASHELRTPVTSLQLSAQLMAEGAVGALTPQQQELVAAQLQDLKRLERMMLDLLDITRLEAGLTPPRFEIVNAEAVVTPAIEAVEAQAESAGVALNVQLHPKLPAIRADTGQLVRALINLLNNAIRHSPAGSVTTVTVDEDDGQVRFAINDQGSGIPADYLPRIFERFVQVPGATRGGAGLGLSLTRSTVEAHGGTIQAQSVLGSGSTFTFSVPAAT